MTNKKLLCTGATGTVITAICCFTPVLAVLLGALGLSAWLGWIDYVLFPALAAFPGITVYAAHHRQADVEGRRQGRGRVMSGAGRPGSAGSTTCCSRPWRFA